ncbi:hypothetical protein [Roseibium sp. Sym1]|uniref:hypothetical protein n=1 Tax=Roseibium sp. Sym1 TaxID=3016006 RepID=UPI0022B4FCBA|nr:hypothetical protein [Roseibium sp. Sym1]
MQFEQPFPGRLRIDQANNGSVITVTAKMRPASFIFLLALFCAWSAVGVVMVQAIQSRWTDVGESEFLLGFSIIWVPVWLYVGTALLWMFAGKEQLVVSNTAVAIRFSMPVLKWSWHYDPGRIAKVRRNAELPAFSERQYLAEPFDGLGRVGIVYGRRTINFGKRLDNSEADSVVALLRDKLCLRNEAT